MLAEKTTQGRAGAGHQTQTRHGFGHDLGTMQRRVEVAHHRTRTGNDRTHGRALQHTPRHQHFNAGAEHTTHRGNGIDHQASEHDGTPAYFVGKRPPKQLRNTKGQQQAAEGVLHHADTGLQVQRHAWQAR